MRDNGGHDVHVLREDGTEAPPNEDGLIAIKQPLPPRTLQTVWGDDERFVRSYFSKFAGWYLTGDGGRFDEDGYLYVMGANRRCHQRRRPSPLDRCPRGSDREPGALERELIDTVRHDVGAVASLKRVSVVPRLPKTRSGKILRATMRAIIDGRDYDMPSTIDDPAILHELAEIIGSDTASSS